MKTISKLCVRLTLVTCTTFALSGCDDVAVYGSMSVGNSWGPYYGPTYHGPSHGGNYNNPRVNSSVTISGRIR